MVEDDDAEAPSICTIALIFVTIRAQTGVEEASNLRLSPFFKFLCNAT
jgi:hypothetical protein